MSTLKINHIKTIYTNIQNVDLKQQKVMNKPMPLKN